MSPGKYQAYPKYVESNIAWLGKVPVHWSPLRFKHALFEKPKTSNPKLDAGSISFGEVVYKHTETLSAETKNSYQEVLPGEFLVNPLNLNFDLKSLRTALSSIAVVVSTGYIVLKSSDRLVKRYVRWLLQEFDVAHMKTLGSGVRQTINYTDIGNSFFYEPPPEEQTQIAKFLDYETANIDALIAKQQQLIALLQEKRQAVISHAVTKGLNPAAPLRDSGVAWLGQVPAHWRIFPSKRLFPESKKRAHPDDEQLTASQDWGVIPQKEFVSRAGRQVVQINQHLDKRKRVEYNDFVVSMRSFQGGLERAWASGGIRSSYVVLKPTKAVEVDYFTHLFKCGRYIQALQATANFIRDGQDLNYQNFCLVDLSLPPREEQIEIARFLDSELAKLESLTDKATIGIELLHERRTALISAAVTGKIDVRGWQPPPAAAAGGFDEPHGAKATVLSNDAG